MIGIIGAMAEEVLEIKKFHNQRILIITLTIF